MKTFNVDLMSVIADIDVSFDGLPAETFEDAIDMAVRMMARPEVWICPDDPRPQTGEAPAKINQG